LPFEKLDSPLPKSNFKANGNKESNSTGIRQSGVVDYAAALRHYHR